MEKDKKKPKSPKQKETPKPKEKSYYFVRVQAVAPVTLTYRILAESPEEAEKLVFKNPFANLQKPPEPNIFVLSKIKSTVYRFGSSVIELVKYR